MPRVNGSEHELVIIGGGPGGYVSALRAAHHGLRVTLVEAQTPGGVCLNTGCIPTKAMVASVAWLRQAKAASAMGIRVDPTVSALVAINQRGQEVVAKLVQGVRQLLEKNKITVLAGRGRLLDSKTVEVSGATGVTRIENPKTLILATGSRPSELSVAPRDGHTILNSDDLLRLDTPPAELLIAGGGYIGCEFASIFATLGSRVTVVEMQETLLPGLDRDLGQTLQRSFRHAGIETKFQQRIEQAHVSDHRVTVTLADGTTVSGDKLLVAVGRTPNTEDLGLEQAGVALDGRAIRVNEHMETTAPGIYAIGDVTGRMALAHVATAQGRVVIDNLLAGDRHAAMNYDHIPAAVFTHPEIATIGLTEDEAKRRGVTVRVGRFPFAAIGKALAAGETEGFVKLIADAGTGRLLGGHIVGGHAAELIGQLALALRLGATAQDLVSTIFAHPTLSEAVLEAAEGVFGLPTHAVRR
ncbi:MAG: dihydrolipoyl dehydrogenase [Pedosphaera sp.]|nr:dihydrolipoyl dehydrogenase [Pedosphaera sp.]